VFELFVFAVATFGTLLVPFPLLDLPLGLPFPLPEPEPDFPPLE